MSLAKPSPRGYAGSLMAASDLRIALISGNYNYVRDGANQALNLLARHLLDQGAALRVYSPTTPTPAFAPTGDLVSAPSFRVPGRGEYRFSLPLRGATRADLASFAPDIVHASAPDVLGFGAIKWARANDIATVASCHTRFETYLKYYRLGFSKPVFVEIQRRFYNQVDRVLAPSPSMAALLKTWGVTTPISIWSRGIDHDRFRPDRRELNWRRGLGIGDDEMAVGFLGRLVKEKGLAVFADVVTELARRGVAHKVLVIGEGPARDWFARRVPGAIFTGFQSGDDLGRAVAGMDVFFNPSVTETFGNVTTEAMAAGVPVVAARATGAIDLVEPGVTGFLAEPRDVGGYADAIARIVADPSLRRGMGDAGHAAALAYRWDRANEAVLAAYREVLGAREG